MKKKGEMTISQLSQAIGITPMGVRQHMAVLERDNLVAYRNLRQRTGRPVQVYSLTRAGNEQFPNRYSQMIFEILDQVKAIEGEEKLDLIFQKRMELLEKSYKPRMEGKDLKNRIEEWVLIRNNEGYMCDWEKLSDDSFAIIQHNCPTYILSSRYPQSCKYDQELFSRVLDAEVTREQNMVLGDVQCRYTIKESK